MGLPKGRTNNISGRKKGVPNKISRELKEQIKAFVEAKFLEMDQIWAKLTPREKAVLLTDLAPYVCAKLQAMAVSADLTFKEMAESDLDRLAFKLYNYGKDKK